MLVFPAVCKSFVEIFTRQQDNVTVTTFLKQGKSALFDKQNTVLTRATQRMHAASKVTYRMARII
jgi:hypothetical protein